MKKRGIRICAALLMLCIFCMAGCGRSEQDAVSVAEMETVTEATTTETHRTETETTAQPRTTSKPAATTSTATDAKTTVTASGTTRTAQQNLGIHAAAGAAEAQPQHTAAAAEPAPQETSGTIPATEPPAPAVTTIPPLTPVNPAAELFGSCYARAEEILVSMTMEEKVGQMFLSRYPGKSAALREVQTAHPGGYVLFAVDFQYQNVNTVMQELADLQAASKIRLMLGADEEGGTVVRISQNPNFRAAPFQAPWELFQQGGLQAIFDEAAEKANLMRGLGLNYVLAPVVDMPKSSSSFIWRRTLGQDAQTTADYASGVVATMNAAGFLSTLKHFPGYGDNVDTHTGIAVDTRPYETFLAEDFQPFISGIAAGVPMIMVNHNIINCMDGTLPATLSPNVHRILREELGFTGLIVTDDLTMGAVQQYVANGEAAVQAVLAGNDMIATSGFQTQKREILQAVAEGRIPEELINDAVRRILACKLYYGII